MSSTPKAALWARAKWPPQKVDGCGSMKPPGIGPQILATVPYLPIGQPILGGFPIFDPQPNEQHGKLGQAILMGLTGLTGAVGQVGHMTHFTGEDPKHRLTSKEIPHCL